MKQKKKQQGQIKNFIDSDPQRKARVAAYELAYIIGQHKNH